MKVSDYEARFNNLFRDIMCSRCSEKVKRKCCEQKEDARFETMLSCIKNIMEPNDEKYPVKVPKGKVD